MAKFRMLPDHTYEHIQSGQQYHVLTFVNTIQFGCTLLAEFFDGNEVSVAPIAEFFNLGEYKEIHNDRFGKE